MMGYNEMMNGVMKVLYINIDGMKCYQRVHHDKEGC